MDISAEDLKAYEAFIEARRGRSDIGADFVHSMIRRLEASVAGGKALTDPPPKQGHYEAELERFRAIGRVMAAMNEESS